MNTVKDTGYAKDFDAAKAVASQLLGALTDEHVAEAFSAALRGDPAGFLREAQRVARSAPGHIANGAVVLESSFPNGGVNASRLGVRNICGAGVTWTREVWPRTSDPEDGDFDVVYVLDVYVPDEPGYEPDLAAVRRAKFLPGVSWEEQKHIEE